MSFLATEAGSIIVVREEDRWPSQEPFLESRGVKSIHQNHVRSVDVLANLQPRRRCQPCKLPRRVILGPEVKLPAHLLQVGEHAREVALRPSASVSRMRGYQQTHLGPGSRRCEALPPR